MTKHPRQYSKAFSIVLLLLAAGSSQGCAALALPLFETAAGIGASTGTSLTLDGIVYRTFSEPLGPVRTATLASLERMGITTQTDEVKGDGRAIVAKAGDRTVYVDLEKLTSKATRMRVTVKQHLVFRDRSTSDEIIAQTEKALENARAASGEVGRLEQAVAPLSFPSTAIQAPRPAVVADSPAPGSTPRSQRRGQTSR